MMMATFSTVSSPASTLLHGRPTSMLSLASRLPRSFHFQVGAAVEPKVYSTDSLILYFKAEGTMEERSIPKVTKALEVVEGVSDLEVAIGEGIASVVLTKETTVQASGVASNLVELIQGAGFKLQTLSLSFEDFDEAAASAQLDSTA